MAPKIRIRTKILAAFLGLSLLSLLLFGYVTLNGIREVGDHCLESCISLGGRAVNDSTTALENQAEVYLLRLATDQADISNTLFEKVESETNVMTWFASALWSNPPPSGYRRSYAQEEEPDDIYATSVYKLAPGVAAVDAVRAELNLSSIMDDIFMPIYANDPHLDLVYIATESGIHRRYPWGMGYHPSYDPRKRGWYKRAVETGEIGWSALYIGASTHELMVTCSRPVYGPEGELFGVVGADVTLKAMNEDIITTQIGKRGYAFLIDNHGNIVARPGLSVGDKKWDESFDTENLRLSDNTELRAIAENMTAGNTGSAKCRFEGGDKYIAYAPLTCTNWSVGIVMPVEEIIAPTLTTKSKLIAATQDTGDYITNKVNSTLNTIIGIFIAMILAVSGMSFLLSRKITNPIMALKKGSEAIGRGEQEYNVEVKTEDELEELATSFNTMAERVKKSIAIEASARREIEDIMHTMMDTLIVVDSGGTIRKANKVTFALLGYNEDELIGKPVDKIIKKEGKEELARLIKAGSAKIFETLYVTKEGKEVPVECSAAPMTDKNGELKSIVCVAEDITERKRAAAKIQASLREKEVLLREIHHRVKNNLQIISSLLNMQVMKAKDRRVVESLLDSRGRIQTMSLIHSHLYQSENLEQVEMGTTIRKMVNFLLQLYAKDKKNITSVVTAGGTILPISQAIPCGLIVNELVSNALKHAFNGMAEGSIEISMRELAGDRITLGVKDNGIGIPEELDIYKTDTLGLKLVRTLAEVQLKGTMGLTRNGGTEIYIQFKSMRNAGRVEERNE